MGGRPLAWPLGKRWTRERGTLWERELSGEPVRPAAAAVPVLWEEAGPDCFGELASAMRLHAPDIVLARVGGGSRAFVGRVDGRIACYGWVSAGSECGTFVGELERAIRLPPGEAYVWDCRTVAEHRRRGLYTALLTHIARALQAEGFGRLWIGSALANIPSIRGFESAGFRHVLRVVYVRAGSATFFLTRPIPRAPHDVVAAARAALVRDGERRVGSLSIGRLRPGPAGLPWCAGIDR